MPLHSGKGRTVAETLGRVTNYVENPEKTKGGKLVIAYQCNLSIADQEFLFSKRQYAVITGRERKDNDMIAYHLRQSFKHGEITPELANKISCDLAEADSRCVALKAALTEQITALVEAGVTQYYSDCADGSNC